MKRLILMLILTLSLYTVAQAETLIPIGFKGKWGYVNEYGNIAIKPQFDDAWDFSEGFATIRINGKIGFINQKGKIVIAAKFDDASISFSEGLVGVWVNKKAGFIDTKGKMVIEPEFDDVMPFKNGFATVVVNGLKGIIDKSGKYIFEPQFNKVTPFDDEGLAPVRRPDNTWSLINNKGIVLFSKDKDLSGYNEGLTTLKENGKYGFVDKNGNWVIKAVFDDFTLFQEGLAVVEVDKKYGVIDKHGNYVVKPIYYRINNFKEGLAHFETFNYRHGFINKKGEVVIKPDLSKVWNNFSDGIALVALTGKDEVDSAYSYIDKHGKTVSHNKFKYIELFENKAIGPVFKTVIWATADEYVNGRFIGLHNDKIGYWNKSGNPIVLLEKECGDEYLVNGAGKVIWPVGFKRNNKCVDVKQVKVGKNEQPKKATEYKSFRTNLKEGDNTHCGLVIEVKKKVVKVQTMIGEHWLKLDQLYPAGSVDCRFVNNIYQEP